MKCPTCGETTDEALLRELHILVFQIPDVLPKVSEVRALVCKRLGLPLFPAIAQVFPDRAEPSMAQMFPHRGDRA